jgi:hypothetical protein
MFRYIRLLLPISGHDDAHDVCGNVLDGQSIRMFDSLATGRGRAPIHQSPKRIATQASGAVPAGQGLPKSACRFVERTGAKEDSRNLPGSG